MSTRLRYIIIFGAGYLMGTHLGWNLRAYFHR
jgi:hypothetical protein